MCGIFGIYNNPDAAELTALGLHQLQHRGQEAAGIVTHDQGKFPAQRRRGLVGDSFTKQAVLQALPGNAAIGHNRYSTAGNADVLNIQPLYADLDSGGVALAHNGNLTNALTMRQALKRDGAIFQSSSDTEVLIHLIARSQAGTFKDRLIDALGQVVGAYCFVILAEDKLIAMRDPYGVRPLSLGKLGDSTVVASETVAFDIIGAEFVRDIEPGELVIIDQKGADSSFPLEKVSPRPDIFEYVYFSRPDSVINGKSVDEVRKEIGRELARESGTVAADVVIPVPDSANIATIGYAQESGLPYEMGIIRNHYVGRTFIEPSQQIRNLGVRLKHNVTRSAVKGKSVVLVDDSIVRGTTSRKIVSMVREAGAREIHFRVSSPPTAWPCFYGIDTPTREELIASRLDVEAIAKEIGVDSLQFLSIDGLYRACGEPDGRNNQAPQFEDSVFTGEYPIALIDQERQNTGGQASTETRGAPRQAVR